MIPILLLALQTSGLENPSYDYSGMPVFEAPSGAVQVKSHSANIEVGNAFADVTSVSEIKNTTDRMLTVRLKLPRFRSGDVGATPPDFTFNATIDGHPLKLAQTLAMPPIIRQGKGIFLRNELAANLYLAKGSTYGVRVNYRVPVGRAGFDRKLRLVGYSLSEGQTVGQFVLSYRTASGVVFRLPKPSPDLGWEIGPRGAFVKKTNFTPNGELTYVTFYPGGFGDIGS